MHIDKRHHLLLPSSAQCAQPWDILKIHNYAIACAFLSSQKFLIMPDIQIFLMSSIKWSLLVFANFTALKLYMRFSIQEKIDIRADSFSLIF